MQLIKNKQTKEMFEKSLKGKELVLYGRIKESKEFCDRYNVKYIIDKNDELWDTDLNGINIYPIEKLYNEDPQSIVILICVDERNFQEVTRDVLEIDEFVLFYWKTLSNDFLSEVSCELFDSYKKVKKIEKLLYDDYSKKVLREVVHRRIIGCSSRFEDLKKEGEVQYLFPLSLHSKKVGSILDCGGYIGDTINRFIKSLGSDINKVYTFEALPDNIRKLENKKRELRGKWQGELIIVDKALARNNRTIIFYETQKKGACYSPEFRSQKRSVYDKDCDYINVETCMIDEVVPVTESVRYIKMDIEGAEYEAIAGAVKTIQREKPGLAISIYHNAEDYYRIAELIVSIVPEYNLAVRHHKAKHVDTILYAWIG